MKLNDIRGRPGRLDVEELEDGQQTRFWQLLRTRYEEMLEQARARLETEGEHPEIKCLQGDARTLRRVLAMPQQLIKELRGGK